ncbi:MAG TPA: glutaredoxin family protein [Methanocella sp.]|uniref:glutaredoxin family protein n=1 Tax=Methanocella sp. TaxID=2052833 RepID=UPI002C033AB4|nr:glutaredoxin family protein [Methanocella sp.]HTY91133.1 glutaredoxin family protein [Methanocella sp.]
MVYMMKVKIYSQPTCPDCNRAKAYLDRKGVPYEDIDVRTNKKALEEMAKRYGIRVTPVIVIGDRVMVGFNAPKIDKFLSAEH